MESLRKKNIIDLVDDFDENNDLLINKYIPDKFHVLVYTNVYDLVDNLIRRSLTEPRGVWLFTEQFVKYYVSTKNKEEAIDTINFNKFVKSLKKIKYEFESEEDLEKFAKNIFNLLGISKITKNKNYCIKPRLNNYDLILNTKDKSPEKLKDMILSRIK